MKKVAYALTISAIVVTFWACTKELEDVVQNRTLDRSTLNADYTDLFNMGWGIPPTTNARISLGRVLFYDTKLSFNNTVSCGSCHKQQFAFADNSAFSMGFKGEKSLRNSKGIQNIAANGQPLFWDSRADSLGQLVTMPIQNHIEMGFEKVHNLPAKLANESYYADLFTQAFGDGEITIPRITIAMRDFIAIIRSGNTRFEQLQNGGGIIGNPIAPQQGFNLWGTNTVAGFTQAENEGLALFLGKARCANCHSGSLNLEGWENVNNGLDVTYADKGVGALPNSGAGMDGAFRTPGLRNIELTGPYMHDGRFKTLEEVVEFYNSGVQNHANLDWRMRDVPGGTGGGGPFFGEGDGIFDPNTDDASQFGPARLGLTATEKQSLVAFLKTLTDRTFTADQRFSNPFRVQHN